MADLAVVVVVDLFGCLRLSAAAAVLAPAYPAHLLSILRHAKQKTLSAQRDQTKPVADIRRNSHNTGSAGEGDERREGEGMSGELDGACNCLPHSAVVRVGCCCALYSRVSVTSQPVVLRMEEMTSSGI